MKKKTSAILCTLVLTASLFAGCGNAASQTESGTSAAAASTSSAATQTSAAASASASSTASVSGADATSASSQETVSTVSSASADQGTTLADGVYTADFNTDSSMFKVNETKDGKGTLTVKDGKMTIHVSLVSENIVNLFEGTKEEAQKDGAKLIEPTVDSITYSDGTTEDVYGFDIPVPAIDKDFKVALIGTKGKWYDHTVSVTNPVPQTEDTASQSGDTTAQS